jgi:hypothetical protein
MLITQYGKWTLFVAHTIVQISVKMRAGTLQGFIMEVKETGMVGHHQ